MINKHHCWIVYIIYMYSYNIPMGKSHQLCLNFMSLIHFKSLILVHCSNPLFCVLWLPHVERNYVNHLLVSFKMLNRTIFFFSQVWKQHLCCWINQIHTTNHFWPPSGRKVKELIHKAKTDRYFSRK